MNDWLRLRRYQLRLHLQPVAKAKQLNERRKDGSRIKQPAEESGALSTPKSSSSDAIANE